MSSPTKREHDLTGNCWCGGVEHQTGMSGPVFTGQSSSGLYFRHQSLNELAALTQDWDSYGAGSIDRAALRTADALMFVPTPFGGVQIELHAGGIDLEIEITSTGKVGEVNVRPN